MVPHDVADEGKGFSQTRGNIGRDADEHEFCEPERERQRYEQRG